MPVSAFYFYCSIYFILLHMKPNLKIQKGLLDPDTTDPPRFCPQLNTFISSSDGLLIYKNQGYCHRSSWVKGKQTYENRLKWNATENVQGYLYVEVLLAVIEQGLCWEIMRFYPMTLWPFDGMTKNLYIDGHKILIWDLICLY